MVRLLRRAFPTSFKTALQRFEYIERLSWRFKPFHPEPEREPDLAAALERLVRPGATCVDAGANIGQTTALLASLVGEEGRVVAFEPFPRSARVIKERLRGSAWQNVVVVEPAAVWERSIDDIPLFPGHTKDSEEWNVVGVSASGVKTEAELHVPAIALDDYFTPGTEPDVVKLDVEGAEIPALRGMTRILREKAPVLVVEIHKNGPEVYDFLTSVGYSLQTTSGDPLTSTALADYPKHVVAVWVG